MIGKTDPDAPLKEIWEIRRRMAEEFGNDRERFHEYLVALQNSPELRDRVVTKEMLDVQGKDSAA